MTLFCLPTLQAKDRYGPGVSDTEIVLGQTVAYSGPASFFGQVGRAMSAYFEKVNAEGGINGRRIRLLSLDDGYSPSKALEQIRRLVEQENVLASVGNLGTQTNLAIYRYLNQLKVPHLFIVSGLNRWNDPKDAPWTIGFLPTYYAETRMYAQYILREVKDPRIAILYQRDDAGREAARGLRDGLGDRASVLIVAEATYDVTDPTIDSQIFSLAASRANVLVNISTPRAAAQAIRKMQDIGWRPAHLLGSPSANIYATFRPAGIQNAVGILSAAYLKDAMDARWEDDAGYKDWLHWMQQYVPNGSLADPYNVLGYSLAQIVVHVLRKCGNELTREHLLRQATSIKDLELPMLLPGLSINTSQDNYEVIRRMQMQRFDGARWEFLGTVSK
jgi:ABC-type branched-subunit amino acid transport system substrate-binding protein